MNESNETQATKPFDQASERWKKVSKIFEAASALTGKEREKFLKKSCGADAELNTILEDLQKFAAKFLSD